MIRIAILALLIAFATPTLAVEFPICGAGKRVTCVVDGDTFWLRGEKFRAEGFDAPEMGPPRCAGPAVGATESRRALQRFLSAGRIGIERHGRSYDRTLARVTVDGVDIGQLMIAAGQARRWHSGDGAWC